MSERIQNIFGKINQNKELNQLVENNQQNSAPNPQGKGLANALNREYEAANNQIANQQQNLEGSGLENDPNLGNANILNENNHLDSEIFLFNAKSHNKGKQSISLMDETLFVTSFIQQNSGFKNYKLTGKYAPNLAKLQELASNCDLEFKIKCAKHFMSENPVKNMRVLYNASSHNAQRAYVDLMLAHSFAFVYAKEINSQLPASKKDPNLEKNLQVLIGNLIASSSSEDIENAKFAIQSTLAEKLSITEKPDFIHRYQTVVNKFIVGLMANKTEANNKISEMASIYNEAVNNLSMIDPNKLSDKEDLFVSNKLNNGLPSQVGIISNYVLSEEKSVDYASFVENKKKIDKLLNEKNELDRILKDPSLKGYTLEQLKSRINREAYGNEYLRAALDAFEKKNFESLKSKVETLFANPGKNDAFANEMISVFNQISRALSSEKAGQMIDILRKSFENFNPDNHEGFKNSTNFKTLKALVLKTGENPELKAQFPEVIKLLSLNRFCFKGFTSIVVPANAPVEQKISAAVSMLEEYAKAVSNPAKAKELLSGKLQSAFNDKFSRFAYMNMVTSLARISSDPALKQQCGYMKAFVAVKDAVDLIKKDNSALAGGPDYGDETPQITALLDKISGAALNQIIAEDLKKLLDYAVNVPLPQLNAIWNTVLYAAYHASMEEKIVRGPIADAPSRVYSIDNDEADLFADLNGHPVNAGVQARRDFIESLSDKVKSKLNATGQGAVREQAQISTANNIARSLNSKLDDKKALQSVLVASDKGKSLLALKEMRQDIYTFGEKWSFDAYDNISDPDELIKIGINKKKLLDTVNKDEKITAEFRAKLEARNEAIGLPTINKLLSAQKLNPGDPVKGENVAVSISILRDNLIDDTSLLDPAILRSYGIDNKELISLSREDISFAKDYAAYVLNKDNNPEMPDDPNFSDERILAFKQKCHNTQEMLEEVLANHATQKPLSKITKLLINKYMQVATLNTASSVAFVNASQKYKDDHPNLDFDNLSLEAMSDMNREVHANALVIQSQYFNALMNGNLHTQNDLINALVSDLTDKLSIYEMEDIQTIAKVTQETPLTTAQKKELISNLQILNLNIDPNSFSDVPEDPVNGKTAFSRDLLELNSASDEIFSEKLNAFIIKHLNLENTTNADSLIIFKAHENRDKTDAAQTSIGTALSDAAMQAAAGSSLEKIKRTYIGGYGADQRNKQALALDTQLRKGDSEVLAPIANKLLATSEVRDEVRLASSYAATKLGYASKNDLFAAYKNPKTPVGEKKKIEQHFMHCMKVRGFDTNMSRLLAKARLNENSNQFILTKIYRKVKSHFFSFFNDVNGVYRSARILFGGLPEDEAEKRAHDYHEYLPALKEMVNRIEEGEIRYVNQNMDFKVNFNPLAGVDLVSGGALDKNRLAKVKASLSLNSNVAMAFTRDQNGKLTLLINASILNVGLSADAQFQPSIAEGAYTGLGGNIGVNRVLDLKFDNNDEAAAFMCKMFTGQLSGEDIRLASDTSSGSSWTVSGKIQVKATLSNLVKGFMHHDELDAINSEKNPDARDSLIDKYAKEHPLMNNIIQFANDGALDLSYKYTRDSKTTIDNTGSTHEVHSTHEIGKKIKLFEINLGGNSKTAVDIVGNIITSVKTKSLNKKNPEIEEKFAKSIKQLEKGYDKLKEYNNSILKAEHIRTFHTSATTGMIDHATDKTICNNLTKDDLEDLQKDGIINAVMRAKLEKLIDDKDIKKVTFVRTLKPSVLEEFKNDKNQLEKACFKVKTNFMISDVIIEAKGGALSTITNNDWMDIVSIGYASFKTENSSSSNKVLRIRATNLNH